MHGEDRLPRAEETGAEEETRRGRPRDPEVDRAIVAATLKLLADRGYRGMSIEAVADEAGVGKTTIYRRHSSKEELVVAAVSTLRDPSRPFPDRGSLCADIAAMMKEIRAVLEEGLSLMGALLVEETHNPDLLELFRERTFRPRRDEAVRIFRRSVERGEIRQGINPEAAAHAIVGSMFVRRLLGTPESEEWMRHTLEIVCRGVLSGSKSP